MVDYGALLFATYVGALIFLGVMDYFRPWIQSGDEEE
jgi:hypothetical protein